MGYSPDIPEDKGPEDKDTIKIPTETPGATPVGATLYRDDRTHLAQVGTDMWNGIRVHPLTIGLCAEAIEVLDRLPQEARFALLGYGPDGMLHILKTVE